MLGRGSGSIGVEHVWAIEHICKAPLQHIVAALDTGHDVAIGGRHHACQVMHSTLSMTNAQHIHAYAQSQPMPPKRLVVLATIRVSWVKGRACVSVSVWDERMLSSPRTHVARPNITASTCDKEQP